MDQNYVDQFDCGVRNAAEFALKQLELCDFSGIKVDRAVIRSDLRGVRDHYADFNGTNLVVTANMFHALEELTYFRVRLSEALQNKRDDGKSMRLVQLRFLFESLEVLHNRFLANAHALVQS